MAHQTYEHIEELRELLPPGSTVYTTVTHVARSGMTRWIRLLAFRDNAPLDISWQAARTMGWPVNSRNHEGIEVGGCGMDMGFHAVHTLSRYLYRDGFECIQYRVNPDGTLIDLYQVSDYDRSRRCSSNDHSNRVDPASLIRDGEVYHDGDGGYALNQRWL
jgi:hypothetical protein